MEELHAGVHFFDERLSTMSMLCWDTMLTILGIVYIDKIFIQHLPQLQWLAE